MQTLTIGDVAITSTTVLECDGPRRKPKDMVPTNKPVIGGRTRRNYRAATPAIDGETGHS
jgi:hypothetical protein